MRTWPPLAIVVGTFAGSILAQACSAGVSGDEPKDAAAAISVDAAAPAPADGGSFADPCAATPELPGACPPRGVFDRPVTVRLTAPSPGASIYYTLDGSDPSPTSGTRYERPVEVAAKPGAGVVVLKALLVTDGVASKFIAVHSYVFPDVVLGQPKAPPGVPAIWGSQRPDAGPDVGTIVADYEMDPRVVNADRPAAAAALKSIPTVSITTKPDELWAIATGIYMNPARFGVDWRRRASMEYFAPGQEASFQIDCGLSIQGGNSVNNWNIPKLSMRVRFKPEFGSSKLRFALFSDSRVTKFDTLLLDAHYNFTWLHWDPTQQQRALYVRDAFASDLQRALGGVSVHHKFVHLYLNGLYWGVYDVHERPDENFAADYLGGSDAEYDVIKHDRTDIVAGDAKSYDGMFATARMGLGVAANYEALKQVLDVDDFINYMLLNFYVGNTDWDYHNWYATRRRVAGAPFRFHSWDAEWILLMPGDNVTALAPMNQSIGKPRELYWALRANADFMARWSKRADELLTNDGLLTPAKVEALLMKRITEVRPALLLESARWGDYRRPAQPYGYRELDAELQRVRSAYLSGRSDLVRNQVR